MSNSMRTLRKMSPFVRPAAYGAGVLLMTLLLVSPDLWRLLAFVTGLGLLIFLTNTAKISRTLQMIRLILITNGIFWFSMIWNRLPTVIFGKKAGPTEDVALLGAIWYLSLFCLSIYEGYVLLHQWRGLHPENRRTTLIGFTAFFLQVAGTLIYAVFLFGGT